MDNRFAAPLLAGMAVALAPHVGHLPPWVPLWCAACWSWLLLGARRGWPMPGKRLADLLAVLGVLAAFAGAGSLIGREAGVSALAVLLAVKPFETTSHRDRMVAVFLTYFLVVSGLFISQSPLMAVSMLAALAATTAALARMVDPDADMRESLRLVGRLLLVGAPLAAVLFLAFPRFPGNVFGLPDPDKALAGFSDSVAPGNIDGLVENRAVVLRATFAREPVQHDLYWRGLALWDFDGKAWTRGEAPAVGSSLALAADAQDCEVILEPHGRTWLFAPDLPVDVLPGGPSRPALSTDHVLTARREVKKLTRYSVRFSTRATLRPPTPAERMRALALPPGAAPRARRLAEVLASGAGSQAEVVDRALARFREEPFVYTWKPPRIQGDPVDGFLFDTRKGFCEHYASAFAVLMRAAGIPARLVVGYLGGEKNPYGEYWLVRQSFAHTWVEIAPDGGGWRRVDPTAAVAPERVELGPGILERGVGDDGTPGAAGRGGRAWLLGRYGADLAGWYWKTWFVDYDRSRQLRLLDRLGLSLDGFGGRLGLLVGVSGALVLAAGLLAGRILRRGRRDPVARAWERFLAVLAKAGVPPRRDLGPFDLLRVVEEYRPDLAEQAAGIVALYARLRYGDGGAPGDAARLRRLVRRFRP